MLTNYNNWLITGELRGIVLELQKRLCVPFLNKEFEFSFKNISIDLFPSLVTFRVVSLSIMNLLSITKVPVSSTINLLEESISVMGFWSLNHLMDGLGFPEAWQGKTAIVLMGRVWLAGPMAMIGFLYKTDWLLHMTQIFESWVRLR